MKRQLIATLLVVFFMTLSQASHAGWFSDTDFYVVVQQSSAGKFIDGWVVQGAPKNSSGVYIFTLYGTKVEKRIAVQSAVVTKTGSDVGVARRWLAVQIEDAAKGFHPGF